jgi:DNA-directed RNA polymerase subunit RPC12/RpoP
MKKADLVEAIKDRNYRHKKYAKHLAVSFAALVLVMFVLASFFPFSSQSEKSVTFAIIFFGYLLLLMISGKRSDARIFKETKMICSGCNKVYDQAALSVIVLENKCSYCGHKIYDD